MLGFSRRFSWALLAILLMACGSLGLGLRAAQVNLSESFANQELAIYAKARTVVDMTGEELRRDFPKECGDLEFDDNQAELNTLLKITGESVEALFRDIPNTGSKEQVCRERLKNDGGVSASSTQNYFYLVLPGKTVSWEEIRTDSKGRPLPADSMPGSSFLTSGHAGLAIFLHPLYQVSSRFRILGRQRKEPNAWVIAFAQKPEEGTPAGIFESELMKTKARTLYQGLAWIDSSTHQIVGMRTDLLAPRRDVKLARQTTEVWYQEVHFANVPQLFRLPREVLVTIEYNGQTFRNRHSYSDYVVFSVESRDKLEQPKIKK
jgi:hypothetical protein